MMPTHDNDTAFNDSEPQEMQQDPPTYSNTHIQTHTDFVDVDAEGGLAKTIVASLSLTMRHDLPQAYC